MTKSTEDIPTNELQSCGILFIRKDFKDVSGCLKPNGHNDFHVCKTDKGKLMVWEDDYSCTCGCWDEWEDGDYDACCIIYTEIKSIDSDNPFNK